MKLLARHMLARRGRGSSDLLTQSSSVSVLEISSIPSSSEYSLSSVAVRLAVSQLLRGGGNAGLICEQSRAEQNKCALKKEDQFVSTHLLVALRGSRLQRVI